MTEITYVARTLIVPAAAQTMAQTMCEQLAEGDAGSRMFVRGLCAEGGTTPTHYISAGHVDKALADLLPLTSVTDGAATVTSGDTAAIFNLAQQAGLSATPEQIEGLLALVDCSEQSPEEAMARLGLVFAPEPDNS